jgi:multidrug efflux pump subunit AcrA (membrane-fusion protein)
MPVAVAVEALPESELAGTITNIDLLPMPGKAVPTYLVEVTLDPTNARVQSGMTATGTVSVEQITDAVVVPTRYLEETEEGTFATIIEEGETRRVAVLTGRTSGRYTQIVNGLTPGQRVVLPE